MPLLLDEHGQESALVRAPARGIGW